MCLRELISELSKLQDYFSYWPIYYIADFCITPTRLYKDYSTSNFWLNLFMDILGSHQNTNLCQYSLVLPAEKPAVLASSFNGILFLLLKVWLGIPERKIFHTGDRTLEKFGKCCKCQCIYVYIYMKIIMMAVPLCNVLSLGIIRRGKLIFLIWFIRLFALCSVAFLSPRDLLIIGL